MDETTYERIGEPGGVRAAKGREVFDWETGRFPMTLATEGEASDGHILLARGAELPERMPLLVQHTPQPMLPALGSVVEMRKHGKTVKATGWVELSGAGGERAEGSAGPVADALEPIRNGYAHMIAKGHLSAVSVRWQGDGVPRSSLKPEHPAYVNAADTALPYERRYGMLFKAWRPTEGSVVAVGADPMATIRERAAEADVAPVERIYWDALIRAHEANTEAPDISAAAQLIAQGSSQLREAGLSPEDLSLALVNFAGLDPGPLGLDLVPVSVEARGGVVEHVTRECYESLRGESLRAYQEAMRLTLSGREAHPSEREPEPASKPSGNGAAQRQESRPATPALEFTPEGVAALVRGLEEPISGAFRRSLDRIGD